MSNSVAMRSKAGDIDSLSQSKLESLEMTGTLSTRGKKISATRCRNGHGKREVPEACMSVVHPRYSPRASLRQCDLLASNLSAGLRDRHVNIANFCYTDSQAEPKSERDNILRQVHLLPNAHLDHSFLKESHECSSTLFHFVPKLRNVLLCNENLLWHLHRSKSTIKCVPVHQLGLFGTFTICFKDVHRFDWVSFNSLESCFYNFIKGL